MFACFEGEFDQSRATRLFSHRSLADRTLGLAASTLAAAFVFGIVWVMGAGDRLPVLVRWTLSGCLAFGMIVVGLVQQFGAWHARRWLRWNGQFAGKYRVKLEDQHVDVETNRFAMRFPYGALALVDTGLSCVRLGFDARALRAVLLPVADCQPPRTVNELKTFVKERRQAGKTLPIETVRVAEHELPVPLEMQNESQRQTFRGPLRQGDLVQSLAAGNQDAQGGRVHKAIYVWLGVCFVALSILLGIGLATGREFKWEVWAQVISVGIFLLIVIGAAARQRIAKSDVQADPDAEVGKVDGWLSPTGIAVYYLRGYTAISWTACDSIEVSEDRILARLWHGDFLLVGRHMFTNPADFAVAREWATAAAPSVGQASNHAVSKSFGH